MADDQRMNIEAYKSVFNEVGIESSTEYFADGLQTITRVRQILEIPKNKALRVPIAALLLDYQMPEANGLQVVQVVTDLYYETNTLRSSTMQLVLPQFVFLSAHLENPDFVGLCKDAGVTSFY